MRIATIFMAISISTLVLFATDAAAQNEVYRWVDENGVVHFGDQPPAHSNAEQVSIQQSKGITEGLSTEPVATDQEPQPSYAQQLREERLDKRKLNAENKKIAAEGCEQMRKLVSELEPSTRVIVRMDDGTVTRLDDNVRLEKLAEAKAYIARNCD